jgi:hypothetical protein
MTAICNGSDLAIPRSYHHWEVGEERKWRSG